MRKKIIYIFILTFFCGNVFIAKIAESAQTGSIWLPKIKSSWQLQYSEDPSGQFTKANIYFIDLFDSDKATIKKLHDKGKKVVCYINAGVWENWRSDKDNFPTQIIGKNDLPWPGEKWLDIRRIDYLAPIIKKRLDQAKEKKCDGIDADNVDGFKNDTGFPITELDQLRYNKWLAAEAHKRNLSIGLKNDYTQAKNLYKDFDWAMVENCYKEDWCDQMKIFTKHNKTVFQIEYTDMQIDFKKACSKSKINNFSLILKNRNLDSWQKNCL